MHDGPCPEEAPAAADLSFVDPQTGWLMCILEGGAGFQGKILYRTGDGGESWEEVANSSGPPETWVGNLGTPGYYGEMFFLDESAGWLIRGPFPTGLISVSHDGGVLWQPANLPVRIDGLWMRSLHFIDQQHGWLLAALGDAPGAIFHTSDGGQMWGHLP